MRFLLDESAERRIGRYLWSSGHDVTSITHNYQRSMHDTEVLAIGVREGRIVVTNDEDFWKLVFNRGYSHSGVILFRPGHMSVESKIRSLELILDDFSDHYHTFFTVTPQGIVARKSMPH